MNKAYLLTGGNLGNRAAYLSEARALIITRCGEISKKSSLYETEAWGKSDQPAFLNQALEIKTALNAKQLMRRILKIEKSIGRTRKEKLGPRIIDIDILFYEDEIHQLPFLNIPHPEIQNRRFALMPLAEINPELIHPVLKKTITQLLEECTDKLEVKQITEKSI
jgi:2-amino-4-hydroxy-6-hydroxymethyldihydropteridine diphosphokinase